MRKIEFGADGIRQIAGRWPLNRTMTLKIGQALGQFARARAGQPFVVIGRDTRPSGTQLTRWLLAGLEHEGVHAVNLGIMTTPGVAYLTRHLEADLGIVVSASHNPPEFNGIKLVGPNGLRLQREDEIEIESLAGQPTPLAVDPGTTQLSEGDHLVELYIQDHLHFCPSGSLAGMKLVLDCANGAAARVAPEVFRRLHAETFVVNAQGDGARINQLSGSEHARTHPEDLAQIIREQGATYGLAFDGDGDRLTIVDAEKRVFDGVDLLFALASYYHAIDALRGNAVVTTELSNRGLSESLARQGIRTLIASKGDKALEAELWHGDYLLGSEPTGNLIINDGHHTAADAIHSAIVLLGILQLQQLSLAEMVAPLIKHPQATVSVLLPVPLEPEAWLALEQEKRRLLERSGGQGRILAWMSSTEPGSLRVMVEGGADSTPTQVMNDTVALCRAALAHVTDEAPTISWIGGYVQVAGD